MSSARKVTKRVTVLPWASPVFE